MSSQARSPQTSDADYSFAQSAVYQTLKSELEKLFQQRRLRCGIDLNVLMETCKSTYEGVDRCDLELNIDQFRQTLLKEYGMDKFKQFSQFWEDLMMICAYSPSVMHLLPVGVILNTVVSTLNIARSVELCPDYPTFPPTTVKAYHAEAMKRCDPHISEEEVAKSFESLTKKEQRDLYTNWAQDLSNYVVSLNNLGLSQPDMMEHHKKYAEEARAKAEAAFSKLQSKVQDMNRQVINEAAESDKEFLMFRQQMSSQLGNLPTDELDAQCMDIYLKTDKRVIAAMLNR